MAWASLRPMLNSLGTPTGQAAVQAPQPVHLAGSMKRGCCSTVTVKLPGSPAMAVTSDRVLISMFRWRPHSTNLGEMMHMEQSLVGKVLSDWAITAPMADFFS